ncbi:hypothetical protein [Micromonospora sp. HK10]|uniref:DUF2201 family putative metallopeptidase n=1 Tax=Micromonospora sp. HK10 TaxID=1538294 RepID=UPI00069778E3|nr:hypothetical protein [Micromonospora sp. HK10]
MRPDPVELDEVMDRLAAARLWAVRRVPSAATAVLAVITSVRPARDVGPGVAVRDRRLAAFPADPRWVAYVDPVTALLTPVDELGWRLLHQVGHLVRGHARRSPLRPGAATGADRRLGRRWRLAADLEVNEELAGHGLRPPPGQPTAAALGLPPGRTAQEYLALLAGDDRDPAVAGDCGSAADGVRRPWDDTGVAGLDALTRAALRRAGPRRPG